MENYNNPNQVRLLMAQTLQDKMFGSPHQLKNHAQLRCLLKAEGIQKGQQRKVAINTSYCRMASAEMKTVIIMRISSLF